MPAKGGLHEKKRGVRADKTFELHARVACAINSALSDEAAVSEATVITANLNPPCSFQGVKLGYEGFVLSDAETIDLIDADAHNSDVVLPWLIGRDLLTGDGGPTRFVIDFGSRSMLDAQRYKKPFDLLRQRVLPAVQNTAKEARDGAMSEARDDHLERWWQFWNVRHEMRRAFEPIRRYLACSQVTKRPIFVFVETSICPDATLQVWSLPDDYSFGVVQSNAHWEWFFANCSKLKSDYRYTRRSVWDTFPWPQSPSRAQIDAVAGAGREVRRVRAEALNIIDGGLRAVYRTLELPGKHPLKDAHAALDAAVLAAYGFSPKQDLLKQLLDLNHTVAAAEKAGQPVTAPGVPASYGDPAGLITDDCIRPE